MQREGRKEAEASKIRAEDEAASRGMNMSLGCGKRLLLEDKLLKAKTREKFKSETRQLDGPRRSIHQRRDCVIFGVGERDGKRVG